MKDTKENKVIEKLVRIVRSLQDTESGPPTVRYLARRLHITQQAVLEHCEDLSLCVNVAIGIAGVGYARHKNIGDYSIEDLNPN